jgi:glutathione S-transferase
MAGTLFGLPASHPTVAAELMLKRKGIPYRRIDLVPVTSKPLLRALGFPGVTVPALRLEGQRLQGSRTISRALDAMQPEPPLFPRDPEARESVVQAEAWGDEVLQPLARRLAWGALKRDRSTIETLLGDARIPLLPTSLAVALSGPVVFASARFNHATDVTVRADLERLPALLDRVDELIAEGVIGGAEPNAADYQIATSVRLLMSHDDIRPAIEDRPAGRLARAVVPRFGARLPAVFPPEWLAGLRAGAPATA